MRRIADAVIGSFAGKEVLPRVAAASADTPLFHGLTEEQRQRLLGICGARSFTPGEPIYRRGQVDGTTHLILEGEVDLVSSAGRIASVSTGQCVGETSLLYSPSTEIPHSVDATAKTAVETATFWNQDFSELIRRRPDIGVVIFRNLAVDISTKLRAASDGSQGSDVQ